jgi:sec-independent protein translocase protein TatC
VNNFQRNLIKYGVYFEELRRKVLLLTKIFVVVFALGFLLTSPALKFILKYINIEDVILVTTSPFQLIELAMSVGFFFACIVVIPIFIYYLYSFLKPALLSKEKNIFLLSLPLALFLFVFGFIYGAGMLYYGIKFIAKTNVSLGIANYWDITSFISQIVLTSSMLGVIFLFPLILTFLMKINILTVEFLRSKRKHAIVGIFILVSLLPPTDGLSLVLMAVPLMLIFELTVLFNKKNSRNLIILK